MKYIYFLKIFINGSSEQILNDSGKKKKEKDMKSILDYP